MASAQVEEFRCFVGGLSWDTTDRGLESAFRPYGSILEAKVVVDRDSGRPKGFGFVTFKDEASMEDAIDNMHGKDLDGRNITVSKAQPKGGPRGGGGGGGGGGYRGGGERRSGGGGGGAGSGNCFKCGESGHWARDCPSGGEGGGRYGERSSYSGGRGGSDRSRSNGGPRDRYGSDRSSRDGPRSSRSGPYDRPSDRSSNRSNGRSYDDF